MSEILLVLVAFAFMEGVAWFSHKYIMHGFLWVLHADHHAPVKKRFEKNDWFALIFATPSILLIFIGLNTGNNVLFSIGLGIALYGLAYFLYHDVLIHKRLNLFGKFSNRYFRGIIKAHEDHHRGKKNYGFLFLVPWRYIRESYSTAPR
jgi:beta-carotene 3-hydroxylase